MQGIDGCRNLLAQRKFFGRAQQDHGQAQMKGKFRKVSRWPALGRAVFSPWCKRVVLPALQTHFRQPLGHIRFGYLQMRAVTRHIGITTER